MSIIRMYVFVFILVSLVRTAVAYIYAIILNSIRQKTNSFGKKKQIQKTQMPIRRYKIKLISKYKQYLL